jgi:hypothetical protein
MRPMLVMLTSILFSTTVIAGNSQIEKTQVVAFFHHLLEKFNNENVVEYEKLFLVPHARHLSDKVSLITDESVPLVDFAKLKEAGWDQSVMRSVDLLFSSSSKAFVNVHWTRLNAEKEVVQNFTAFYTLVKIQEKLRIAYIAATSTPLSIGVTEKQREH